MNDLKWLTDGLSHFQVIVYDHGQVIEDPALIGRVGFTGKTCGNPFYYNYDVLLDEFRGWRQDKNMIIPCKRTAGIPWSADIVLNDTRVSDAGIYRCMVNNPPETADPGIGELELSVMGECVAYSPLLLV